MLLLSLHVNPKLKSAVSYIGYILFTFLNQLMIQALLYPHFSDKETEAERHEEIGQRSPEDISDLNSGI